MTKHQYRKALERHNRRELAKRAERIILSDYPASHNPYLPHERMADCYPGCLRPVLSGRIGLTDAECGPGLTLRAALEGMK